MAPLPGLNKGVTKDPTPPGTDTVVSPIAIPDGTTLVTTKTTNETIDNVDQIIDYISGDAGPNFIPQLAITDLVSDLAGKEDSLGFTPENIANKVTVVGTPGNDTNYPTEKAVRDGLDLKEDSLGFTPEDSANKGVISGYAGLDASQELLLTNFPSGIALQVLRRNAGNTALEFATISDLQGVTSINADTTAAQVIAAGTGLGILDAGATHTLSIDATVATLTGSQILTNKTITAVANTLTIASTDLTDTANIARDSDTLAFFSATTSLQLLGVISDETGSGSLVFGTSPTIVTPTIASFTNSQHDHQAAAGGGQLDSTLALSDTANIAYLNTANAYTAGVRQDFLGLLAGTAGLNIGGIAGNPTTQVDGDVWLNTSTNQIFGRINGADVDLGAGGGSGITSINADTTAAQILAGTTNRISLVDAGDTHTFDIDTSYVGQSSITTLGTITTGVWNGTAITGANINAASTDLTDTASIARSTNNLSFFAATTSSQLAGVISDETGSGLLVFGTSPVLTTPRFADLGFIADANGNEMLAFDTVASAVNYIQLTNAATLGQLSLSSLGDDANIDFRFIPKGSGTFYGVRETWAWPLTDETTAPTTGVKYTTEPAPYDMSIEDVIAGLTTAGTGGTLFTIDVLKETGVNTDVFSSIFTTNLATIDASEFTSTTATTQPNITTTTWEKGRRLQLSISALDTNGLARGAKIELLTHATAK